jgi:hypothetical protein
MMYFDLDIHMTMDSWSALTLSAILVLYTITCYIYMRNFANLCIMVWMHMNIYEKLCKFMYNGLDSGIGFTWMHMNIYEKLCKFVYNGLDSRGCT